MKKTVKPVLKHALPQSLRLIEQLAYVIGSYSAFTKVDKAKLIGSIRSAFEKGAEDGKKSL